MTLSVVTGFNQNDHSREDVISLALQDLTAEKPLVIDLDGTLLNSDILVESLSSLVASSPIKAFRACLSLRDGKAALKANLAQSAQLDLETLPWNTAVVRFMQEQHRRGRRIYLASASDRRWVDAVAKKFQCFAGTFASDGTLNLAGPRKAAALREAFGVGGFDYIGNATVDIPVWREAAHTLVANASPGTLRRVKAIWPEAQIIDAGTVNLRLYLKSIRPHHWMKNLLILVPALTAHAVNGATLFACLLGFISFSLCASSVYVLNDLIDLERDRNHSTKRRRPFASGQLPVLHGFVMIPALLGMSLLTAIAVSPKFFLLLLSYYVLTLAYSLFLKRQMMLDVVVLACLYGMRLAGGSVATDIALSAWLGAFSIFFFMGLALIKRSTELVSRINKEQGNPSGRGYRLDDLPIVEMLSAASSMTAVLVYALYVNSPIVQVLYHHPARLSLVCVVLVYWISRILILSHRGEMHDDPIVFAVTDRTSQICGIVTAAIILASV